MNPDEGTQRRWGSGVGVGVGGASLDTHWPRVLHSQIPGFSHGLAVSHVPEQRSWELWGRITPEAEPAGDVPGRRRSIDADNFGRRMDGSFRRGEGGPTGRAIYRTNHDRIGPTVTGTTSLTSTVNRQALRTVCTWRSG